MSTVTMSLYQALERRKILQKQVDNISSHSLCCIRRLNSDTDTGGIKLSDILENYIKPGYQKSIALTKNLINLKAAINDANSKITIEIDGKTYSIANAIVVHRNLDLLISIYSRALGDLRSVKSKADSMNERNLSKEAISDYLEKALGDAKRSPEIVEQMTKSYIDRMTVSVYDPLGIGQVAVKEIEHLEKFRDEIHYKLTEANVNNTITVEFED